MAEPLAQKSYLQTSFGKIAYLESGTRKMPPVLFVHGIPTSGYLWREVIRFLGVDFHCFAPDLMGLGDTQVEPADRALGMDQQAEMLVELMETLGHRSFGLVCHDQGGAAAQLIVARRPAVVRCFVATNCVCYDNWPVPAVVKLQHLLRVPMLPGLLAGTRTMDLVETATPLSSFRGGVYRPDRLSDETIREYLRPFHAGHRERELFRRFFLAGSDRYTMAAVAGLRRFEKPTQVLWALEDRYIPPSWALELFEDLPGAEELRFVPFCGHFWQEERPAEFVSHMLPFLQRHLAESATETDSSGAQK